MGSPPRHFRHTGTFFPGLGSPEQPLLYVLTEVWLTFRLAVAEHGKIHGNSGNTITGNTIV
jgi:hypothetical protein